MYNNLPIGWIVYFFEHLKIKEIMKEKEEKKTFIKKVFSVVINFSKNNPDFFNEREKKILSYLLSFVREGILFLEPIFIVEACFKDLENFDLEYQGKKIRCYLVEVNERVSSDWIIKSTKITHPGKTLFLGSDGADFLRKKHQEKFQHYIGRAIHTLSSKHSASSKNDIWGFTFLDGTYKYHKNLLHHPSNIPAKVIFAVFKEIAE